MTRPTCLYINQDALLHNLQVVKKQASSQKIIAMVKANAYGCGVNKIVPVLDGKVAAFGVACMEEAIEVLKLSKNTPCILFQGVFTAQELQQVYRYNLQTVIHTKRQLDWILAHKSKQKIKVWVKINTGMHRLGFLAEDIAPCIRALRICPWVDEDIGIFTHLACADEPDNPLNQKQIANFAMLTKNYPRVIKSIANSAAILTLPNSHADYVRAGLMLYGVSPLRYKSGRELGLKPVMQFKSEVSAIHHYPPFAAVGYGATWRSDKPTIIGVVPVGYADGYPRCIKENSYVWVAGYRALIVGRISMDMLTIDLTNCKKVQVGDEVEMWGEHIAVDDVANAAHTIGYEIIARIGNRVIRK